MATTEERVDKLEEKYGNLHTMMAVMSANINSLANELKEFKREMQDFKTEMRDRDNQRHAEIQSINKSIDGMGKHVRNLTIAAMAGIGAMVIAVVYSVAK